MDPQPDFKPGYPGSSRLAGKAPIVTGSNSGIGRTTSVVFAREAAKVTIVYLEESEDAETTKAAIEKEGGDCLLIAGNVGEGSFCNEAVRKTVERFGRLDVLVNNAAHQNPEGDLRDLTEEELAKHFETNIYGYIHMIQAALDHFGEGSAIDSFKSRRQEHPGERGRAGAGEDAVHSHVDAGRAGGRVRLAFADETCRPPERDRAVGAVSELPGFIVHDRQVLHPNGGKIVGGWGQAQSSGQSKTGRLEMIVRETSLFENIRAAARERVVWNAGREAFRRYGTSALNPCSPRSVDHNLWADGFEYERSDTAARPVGLP